MAKMTREQIEEFIRQQAQELEQASGGEVKTQLAAITMSARYKELFLRCRLAMLKREHQLVVAELGECDFKQEYLEALQTEMRQIAIELL